MFKNKKAPMPTGVSPALKKRLLKARKHAMWSFPILLVLSYGIYWLAVVFMLGVHKEENHKLYLQVDTNLLGLLLTLTILIIQLRGKQEFSKLINTPLWVRLEASLFLGKVCMLCTIFLSYIAIKASFITGNLHASFEAMFMYTGYMYLIYIVFSLKNAFKYL
jgi:hypothetical protein